MPLLKPFCALHYNLKRIKDLSSVVCPPYDTLNKKEADSFKKKFPYNFCNILLVDEDNDYRKLKEKFYRWIDEGILIRDKDESFYLYEQEFEFAGKIYRRVGIVGLLKMDKEGVIFPHERTLSSPKKDRYYILRELKANLSPIFILTPGKVNILKELSSYYHCRRAFIDFVDTAGIRNRVWRVRNREFIRKVQRAFARRTLLIADGHHRFEVSYRYFKRMKGKFKDLNYILAYFTDGASGILMFPTHRVVKIGNNKKEEFLASLRSYFEIKSVSRSVFKRMFEKENPSVDFGLSGRGEFYFLYLKKNVVLDKILKKKEQVYSSLNVYILHRILDSLNIKDIEYTHSLEEAIKMTTKGRWAFILTPPPLETVFSIALKGYRLPQKTTYFYPKLLSGILIRKFSK